MDLVIGSSSQLAHYFPDSYIKISSRNIDFNYLKNNQWGSVYITFAEQRIYDKNIDFITPNYIETLKVIDSLLYNSNRIICYTSCELWANLSGKISAFTQPDFSLQNEYAISKFLLLNKIRTLRYTYFDPNHTTRPYSKVLFMHPFYFNSVYRNEYFLFGKIFKSIINKEKILVNNLDFYRDMVSPQFVVNQSIKAEQDCMIGSGKLFNVRDFIKDLYKLNNMNFDNFVYEDNLKDRYSIGLFPPKKEKLIMADVDWNYTYDDLIKDTMEDIKNYKIKFGVK